MTSSHPTKTRPIPQEAFDWYDEYAHGLIDRRTFMSRLAGLTAAGFSMAALTTALGLIPLLLDAFFVSMAVTIIFGLMVATVLTMVVVPVLYAIFFRVPYPRV